MCLYASPIYHRGTRISAGFAYLYVKHMLFKSKSNTLSNFPLENLHAKEVSLNRALQLYEAYITFPNRGLFEVQYTNAVLQTSELLTKIVHALSNRGYYKMVCKQDLHVSEVNGGRLRETSMKCD